MAGGVSAGAPSFYQASIVDYPNDTLHPELRGQAVVITGGARGIGLATAQAFARQGARLALLDMDAAALDEAVAGLSAQGVQALACQASVTDADAVERAFAQVEAAYGRIDVLVNNAGITHRGTFAETGLGVFRKVMAVNFFGAVHCTRAALPSLLERRGQIVVLGSLTGFAPLLYRSAYNASKHALHGLFDTLRMELEGTGVSVTLACPGFTATDLRKNALVGDGSVTRQPVQVLGSQVASPVEVAEAIFQGAARRRRLLVLSNVNWRARLLARFFPRLFEKLLVPRLSGLKPQP